MTETEDKPTPTANEAPREEAVEEIWIDRFQEGTLLAIAFERTAEGPFLGVEMTDFETTDQDLVRMDPGSMIPEDTRLVCAYFQ